ncbi:MFS transporter [Maritalea myrionectae]|uniref:MFS transporter n=1 Tax=Maritalea myrionectae TaxID=454601 RepID=UPI000425DD49|nr:MFS transporter [Maritalea myrionectae]
MPFSLSFPSVLRDPRGIALLLAATLTTMANATISPALAGLELRFADHPQVELLTRLLVPAPSISVVLFAPFIGILADRVGRRMLLLSGVILFVLSGLAGVILQDLNSIFASRLVMGVAVALIMTAQTALIGDYFEGDQRQQLMGLQISARNFGGFVAIFLAGLLAAIAPEFAFLLYGLAALFLPLMWRVIVDPPRLSAAQRATGANARPAPQLGWPLVLLGMILLQMLTSLIFFVMPTQLPFFLKSMGLDPALATGNVLGALTISGGIAALLYARLHKRIGAAGTLGLGYGIMAAGFLVLMVAANFWLALIGAILVGWGFASVMPNFVAIALKVTPAQHRGRAGGLLTMSVFLGQIISPFVSMALITRYGFNGLYGVIAALLLVFALCGAGRALMIRHTAPPLTS